MQDKRQHKGFYLLFGSEWHKKVSPPFFQYKIRFHCTLLLLLLLDGAQEIQTQLWVTFSRNNVKCDCSRLETWESARLGGIEVKRQIHFCSLPLFRSLCDILSMAYSVRQSCLSSLGWPNEAWARGQFHSPRIVNVMFPISRPLLPYLFYFSLPLTVTDSASSFSAGWLSLDGCVKVAVNV